MPSAESKIRPPGWLGDRVHRSGRRVLCARAREGDGGPRVRGRGEAAVAGLQSSVEPRGPSSVRVKEGHDPGAVFPSVPSRGRRPGHVLRPQRRDRGFRRPGREHRLPVHLRPVRRVARDRRRPIAEFKQAIAKAKAAIDTEFPRKVESYTFVLIDGNRVIAHRDARTCVPYYTLHETGTAEDTRVVCSEVLP